MYKVYVRNKVRIRHKKQLHPRCTEKEPLSSDHQLPLDLVTDIFRILKKNCRAVDTDTNLLPSETDQEINTVVFKVTSLSVGN